MSSSEARPRQVTTAAWLVGVASLFLLFSVVGEMGLLRSVASREALEKVAWRESLGIDVEAAISISRVMLFVAGAAAAAAVVAAFFCARRDRSARIVASVAAVLVFPLSGMVLGDPFLGAFVAAGATLLWTGQAGDWFAGRPIREVSGLMAPRPDGAERRPGGTPSGAGPAAASHADPTTTAPVPAATRPPQEVTMAALITATTSAAVVIGMVFDTLRLLTDPDSLDQTYADSGLRDQGIAQDYLAVAAVVGAGLITVWALGAVGLAWLSTRRHSWARILLMVSAGLAALTTLAVSFGQPLALVVTLACLATIYLLTRPQVGRWYAAPESGPGPGPGAGAGASADHEASTRTDA